MSAWRRALAGHLRRWAATLAPADEAPGARSAAPQGRGPATGDADDGLPGPAAATGAAPVMPNAGALPGEPLGAADQVPDGRQQWLARVAHLPPQAWQGAGAGEAPTTAPSPRWPRALGPLPVPRRLPAHAPPARPAGASPHAGPARRPAVPAAAVGHASTRMGTDRRHDGNAPSHAQSHGLDSVRRDHGHARATADDAVPAAGTGRLHDPADARPRLADVPVADSRAPALQPDTRARRPARPEPVPVATRARAAGDAASPANQAASWPHHAGGPQRRPTPPSALPQAARAADAPARAARAGPSPWPPTARSPHTPVPPAPAAEPARTAPDRAVAAGADTGPAWRPGARPHAAGAPASAAAAARRARAPAATGAHRVTVAAVTVDASAWPALPPLTWDEPGPASDTPWPADHLARLDAEQRG